MRTRKPDDDRMDDERPSKSERKREMHDRQKLGERLAALNPAQLATIPLDPALHEAMADYRRFHHKEAKRRQLQFIGKLMRDVDVDAIARAYELTQAGSEASKQQQHRLERWRDRLLTEGDDALNDALAEFPALDRQAVRQLVRTAAKEKAEARAPAASRALFRLLRTQRDIT